MKRPSTVNVPKISVREKPREAVTSTQQTSAWRTAIDITPPFFLHLCHITEIISGNAPYRLLWETIEQGFAEKLMRGNSKARLTPAENLVLFQGKGQRGYYSGEPILTLVTQFMAAHVYEKQT